MTKKERKRKRSKPSERNTHGHCTSVSERFEKLGRIGEGTYGIVYKARDKNSQKLVALKRCLPHNESSDGFPLTTLREIQSLRICKHHDNIVHLEEIAVSNSGVFLVFEYCASDLAQTIDHYYQTHHKSPFTQTQVKRLMYQLLSALEYMHSRFLIHRDIKLSNLLYSTAGVLKLADFGLARKLGPSLTPKVVSLWYRPPELLLGSEDYTTAVDVWGAGCVCGELLEGVPLMDGKNELDQLSKVFELLGPPTVAQWPVCVFVWSLFDCMIVSHILSLRYSFMQDLANMPLIKNGTFELPQTSSFSSDGKSLLDRFSYLSASGLSLLSKLLSYDYLKRGTATQALHSIYFTELPPMSDPSLMPKFPSLHKS